MSQNNAMEQMNKDTTLEQDRQWAETLLNKQSLSQFNLSKTDAPFNYFESFPEKVMSRIENEKRQQKEKRNATLFFLPSFMQPLNRVAIAAAVIIIVGGSFIFLNNSVNKKTAASIVAAPISIQDLSSEEIEAYVDTNEWIAEIDVQSQMNKENTRLSTLDENQIEEIKNTLYK
jgi:negative regulator of sigma E activity